jgi:ribosomal protein S12 methylthiotransferase accessory factor
MAREPEWRPAADFSNLTGFDEHARLYLYRPDLIPEAFGFCDRVEEEVPLSAIPDRSTGRPLGDLRHLVERLREVGSEVVAVDITSSDVGQVGFSVVRVLATRLVPLHGNHLKPFLAPSRLYEVPERLGWRRHGWDPEAGLNPFPHPFP